MKKVIDFDEDLRDMIQEFANENCRRNFTFAVDTLCRDGLLSHQLRKFKARDKAEEGDETRVTQEVVEDARLAEALQNYVKRGDE